MTIGRIGTAMLAALLSAAGPRADEPASSGAPSAPPPDATIESRTRDVHRTAAEAVDTARRWIEAGESGKALVVLHEAMRATGGVDTTGVRFMAAQALQAGA